METIQVNREDFNVTDSRANQAVPAPVAAKATLTSVVETFAKLLALSGGISYAVGVIIVTSNLYRFHAVSFSLAKPQYVLVGTSWFVASIFALLMPALLGILSKRESISLIYPGLKTLALLLSWLLFSFVMILANVELQYPWSFLLGLAFLDSFTFWTSRNCAKAYESSFQASLLGKAPKGDPVWVGVALVSIFILPGWTSTYINEVYPNLPQSLGGGQYPLAQVVFQRPKDNANLDLNEITKPITLCDLTTEGEVYLLPNDGDFMVLLSNAGTKQPVYVSKSLIASVRFYPNPTNDPNIPGTIHLLRRVLHMFGPREYPWLGDPDPKQQDPTCSNPRGGGPGPNTR
jgi:hypothetical protein